MVTHLVTWSVCERRSGLPDSKVSATDHHHVPSAMPQDRARGASLPEGLSSYWIITTWKVEASYAENELFIQCGWEEERRNPFH